MPESRSGGSAFETRLAAMDRRLRELQDELAPGRAPAPVDEPAPLHNGNDREFEARASRRPPPAPAPIATGQSDALRVMYTRLLASMRELLAGYELLAEGPAGAPGAMGVPGAMGAMGASPGSGEVAVSAGPFSGTAALRDFERELSGLPGVRAVTLRGYDTEDRAVWDVELR